VKLDPNNPDYRYELGFALAKQNHLDEAMESYNWALREDPHFAAALKARGEARGRKRDWTNALEDFTSVIKMGEGTSATFYNRGQALMEIGEWDKAIMDFTKVVQLDPVNKAAYKFRGHAYRYKKAWQLAISDYTEAIKLGNNEPRVFYDRGFAYEKMGNCTAALRDARRAYALQADYANAYSLEAWVLATCPDPGVLDGARAIFAAQRACELSTWTNRINLDVLAAAYAEAGKFDLALKYETDALEGVPLSEERTAAMRQRLNLYGHHKPYRQEKQPPDALP
jgi:tetratricopeptide (TPR) repeat protein